MIAAFQAGTEPELLDYIGTLQEQGPKLVAGLRVLAMLLASAQHAVASEIPQGGSSQAGARHAVIAYDVYAAACDAFSHDDAVLFLQAAVHAIDTADGAVDQETREKIKAWSQLIGMGDLTMRHLMCGNMQNLQSLALPLALAVLPKYLEFARSLGLCVPHNLRLSSMDGRMSPALLSPLRECNDRVNGVFCVCSVLMATGLPADKPSLLKGLRRLFEAMHGTCDVLLQVCSADAANLPQAADLADRLPRHTDGGSKEAELIEAPAAVPVAPAAAEPAPAAAEPATAAAAPPLSPLRNGNAARGAATGAGDKRGRAGAGASRQRKPAAEPAAAAAPSTRRSGPAAANAASTTAGAGMRTRSSTRKAAS